MTGRADLRDFSKSDLIRASIRLLDERQTIEAAWRRRIRRAAAAALVLGLLLGFAVAHVIGA